MAHGARTCGSNSGAARLLIHRVAYSVRGKPRNSAELVPRCPTAGLTGKRDGVASPAACFQNVSILIPVAVGQARAVCRQKSGCV